MTPVRMRLPAELASWIPAFPIGLRLLCSQSALPTLPPRDARLWITLTDDQAATVDELQEIHDTPRNAIVTAALICASQAPTYALPADFTPPPGDRRSV